MLCSVYTTIAGEYCDPGFCTPIGSCAVNTWNTSLVVKIIIILVKGDTSSLIIEMVFQHNLQEDTLDG